MKLLEALKLSGIPVVVASLCCLSPLILVMLGLSTASFAGSLANTLYGEYKWLFRAVGLVFLVAALVLYFRRQRGICTIDEARRRKREIVNATLLTFIVSIGGYLFFLYVIVHYAGVFFGVWADYFQHG